MLKFNLVNEISKPINKFGRLREKGSTTTNNNMTYIKSRRQTHCLKLSVDSELCAVLVQLLQTAAECLRYIILRSCSSSNVIVTQLSLYNSM